MGVHLPLRLGLRRRRRRSLAFQLRPFQLFSYAHFSWHSSYAPVGGWSLENFVGSMVTVEQGLVPTHAARSWRASGLGASADGRRAGEAWLEAHQPCPDLAVRKEDTSPPPGRENSTAAQVDCGSRLQFTVTQCLGRVAAAGLHLRHLHR